MFKLNYSNERKFHHEISSQLEILGGFHLERRQDWAERKNQKKRRRWDSRWTREVVGKRKLVLSFVIKARES